jgi:hypothetical protein
MAQTTTTVVSTTPAEATTTSTESSDASGSAELNPLTTPVPDLDPIRTITPDEWGFVIGQCLIERGFDVTIVAADHLNFQNIPASQQEALLIAQAECKALFPMDDRYTGGLDEEQLTRLYAYYVDTLVHCLEGQGYSGFNPPSFATYLESYPIDGGWHPYTDIIDEVDQLGPGGFASLNWECPQSPGTEYLFGE